MEMSISAEIATFPYVMSANQVSIVHPYREDMEKVNVKFHDNYTVSYQHKKILHFVPELSVDGNLRITTPNIPVLVSAILLMIKIPPNYFLTAFSTDAIDAK